MDWDAELYDRQHGFVGAYGNDLVDLVRAIAREREDGGERALRILDVGCGTGAHLDALGEIGDAVGVDASPAMVARAPTCASPTRARCRSRARSTWRSRTRCSTGYPTRTRC
nr:class I SAM-dependent methyltransferase [Eggerthella guodeyinii]